MLQVHVSERTWGFDSLQPHKQALVLEIEQTEAPGILRIEHGAGRQRHVPIQQVLPVRDMTPHHLGLSALIPIARTGLAARTGE